MLSFVSVVFPGTVFEDQSPLLYNCDNRNSRWATLFYNNSVGKMLQTCWCVEIIRCEDRRKVVKCAFL